MSQFILHPVEPRTQEEINDAGCITIQLLLTSGNYTKAIPTVFPVNLNGNFDISITGFECVSAGNNVSAIVGISSSVLKNINGPIQYPMGYFSTSAYAGGIGAMTSKKFYAHGVQINGNIDVMLVDCTAFPTVATSSNFLNELSTCLITLQVKPSANSYSTSSLSVI